jgi:hypothetical protein
MILLTIFTVLLFLVFLFIILLSIFPIKVAASFNSEQYTNMHILLTWLNPILRALISKQDNKVTLTVYLFGNKILGKSLNFTDKEAMRLKEKDRSYYIDMAKSIKINHAKLYSSYGFSDPALTGIICGLMDFITRYINLQYLYNNADFFTDHSYFNVNAEADINVMVSLFRILKRKTYYSNLSH